MEASLTQDQLSKLRLEKLSLTNFSDYERLTSCQADGGCYCSFWHQKWNSMQQWQEIQRTSPETNRSMVYEKVRSGFHVGVLAYLHDELVAWICIGTLPEFYWTWKRVAQVGESASAVGGILCFSIAESFRGKRIQEHLLNLLKPYAQGMGWKSIEGYPFDLSARQKHKADVRWPGLTDAFEGAGFQRSGAHWLSTPEAERSIFKIELS